MYKRSKHHIKLCFLHWNIKAECPVRIGRYGGTRLCSQVSDISIIRQANKLEERAKANVKD